MRLLVYLLRYTFALGEGEGEGEGGHSGIPAIETLSGKKHMKSYCIPALFPLFPKTNFNPFLLECWNAKSFLVSEERLTHAS